MPRVVDLLPELEGEESQYIQQVISTMSDGDAKRFTELYRARRKRPSDILLFSIIGLVIIPGLQRFMLNQIGMGLLFLFTAGLCLVGSIIDLINHQTLCFEYNRKVANEISIMLSKDLNS